MLETNFHRQSKGSDINYYRFFKLNESLTFSTFTHFVYLFVWIRAMHLSEKEVINLEKRNKNQS